MTTRRPGAGRSVAGFRDIYDIRSVDLDGMRPSGELLSTFDMDAVKVVEQAGEGAAMAQLVERGYADKYRAPGVHVHLVGLEFSSASRNVAAFEHAAA